VGAVSMAECVAADKRMRPTDMHSAILINNYDTIYTYTSKTERGEGELFESIHISVQTIYTITDDHDIL
jgi:hypothetical protein